ncbi:MAG TPA: MerR family transcriptional regulator [Longimicrobium sp.]|nr:MerR family transcriptional regulator [Longimicrobium sp.]
MNSEADPGTGAAGLHPIGVAARRSGVAEHLLRAWERRYAAVRPVRGLDGARLYTDADVERLRLLRLAAAAGRPIGRLAALPDAELAALVQGDGAAPSPAPRTGVGRAAALVDAALDATRGLDGAAAQREMRRAAVSLSPGDFVEHFAVPLLRRTGELWADGEITAAHEHVASAALRGVLAWLLDAFHAPAEAPLLVAGTPAGHAHEFGAMLACVTAGDEGWRTLYLGPDLPARDLAAAAVGAEAAAVAISALLPRDAAATAREVAALRRALPAATHLVLGGAALDAEAGYAARGTTRARDYTELRSVLRALARGRGAPAEGR